MPDNSNKIEKKFGRNIQALTFALPFKKRVVQNSERCEEEGQKIFESWETIALYPAASGIIQKGKSS